MSIQQSGAALRQAAAEARLILLELAAARLSVALADLDVDDGRIAARGATSTGAKSTTYWELVTDTTLQLEATGRATPKPASQRRLVGRPVQRLDIPAKVFGEPAFVQDLRLPGMLHARVVRPPNFGARLASVDEAAARKLPGVVRIVRDGSFLAVVAEREEQAIAAAETLAAAARWEGATALPPGDALADVAAPRAVARRVGELEGRRSCVRDRDQDDRGRVLEALHRARVARPSCAVAQKTGDRLRVWTHGQGVFPMRTALSKVLSMPPDRLRVTHMDGSGCYGHNGADDAACDAALIANALDGESPAAPCACSGRARTSRRGRRSGRR